MQRRVVELQSLGQLDNKPAAAEDVTKSKCSTGAGRKAGAQDGLWEDLTLLPALRPRSQIWRLCGRPLPDWPPTPGAASSALLDHFVLRDGQPHLFATKLGPSKCHHAGEGNADQTGLVIYEA